MESDRLASYYRPAEIQGIPGYPQPVYRDIQSYIAQQQSHQHQTQHRPVQQPPPPPIQVPQSVHRTQTQAPLTQPNPVSLPQMNSHPILPGKDRSRPRGRMTPYAFFVQERRQYYRRHGIPVAFTAFSKECSALWKELTSEEKSRYQKMSEEDKERYQKETATYNASLGQGYAKERRARKGRRRKDPGQPKRNMCAFLHFCGEKRPKLKVENPNYNIGQLSKQLSVAWKVMTAEQKQPYQDMAIRDKLRYEQQKQAYEAGYTAAVSQQGPSSITQPTIPQGPPQGVLPRSPYDHPKPYHPRRKKKDPDMPKRNMSAFMFYSKTKRPHIRAQQPTLRVGQLAQILSAQWKIMTPTDKAPYDDMARKDKSRYEVQLKAYRKGEYIPLSDQHDIDQICRLYS